MTASSASNGREIVWDTETTGFDPSKGHRLVEIACVEIVDLMPTGREFHAYIDPERDVPEEVVKVHGLTREFLRGKPKFKEIVDDFLEFVGDSPMVAHNASFDMRFINAELGRLRRPPLSNRYIDTVAVAKRQLPAGSKVTLDDLCNRFGIDRSARTKHGALIDTRLLARVYLELSGGREHKLQLEQARQAADYAPSTRPFRAARGIGQPSPEDLARHDAFVGKLKEPLWRKSAAPAA